MTRTPSPEDLEKANDTPPSTVFGEQLTKTESQGAPPEVPQGALRKIVIMSVLCSAQFFDIFNAVSSIACLPKLGEDLGFTPGALQWVLSAYTLTFAAFMVSAGRISDIYHPKPVFCAGYMLVGIMSVLCAVSVHPIMLLVFRAVQGIGAALTIPSAIAMIVQNFPDPEEQGRALSIFGAFGAVGNVIGFVLGGVLTARVNWRWVYYLVAIIVIPFAVLSFFALPKHSLPSVEGRRGLDWPGVATLTAGLILFVYAISDANDVGWGKPQIIVTLILSVVFIIGFFFVERFVKDPAVPPSIWSNQNFTPLFLYTWSVYWFLMGSELQLVLIFQDLFGWSPLSAAVHCIPIGVSGGISAYLTGVISPYIPRRILLVLGQLFMAVGVILFALVDSPDKYWSHVFPGMIVGMCGLALGYVGANIAIMAGARPGEEGVVGAMMNTAFQLGATIGLAGAY
ncbi:hypothetical protein BOTBODRAFT_110904 [Botryobasidium botryosum FD-172 SS1]|uniref:Major facilitator superfamily (MFS) profile domain-containing protein n=1 Tax=Botryobasidium botryosum (strain FD-172 SS1) TaxID=930990 RepID=A0A067MQN3_BOTB1|nr:hypothetical protein BOTBODRAFT_110904 [Botryobasidium botryosum FD-172 SS1]